MESTKLHVKVGNSEFDAEGLPEWVKEAYDRFLESLKSQSHESPPPKGDGDDKSRGAPVADKAFLDGVFTVKDNVVSLRHLPTTESATRTAECAILILYGFKRMLGIDDVQVTKLNEGLRQSGITIRRLDKVITVHSQLYRKGGTRSGGRYSLTNAGELQAHKWLTTLFAE